MLDAVLPGDELTLSTGEVGTVTCVEHVGGELIATVDWRGQVGVSENKQTVASIRKWVAQGVWKLRRKNGNTTKRKI